MQKSGENISGLESGYLSITYVLFFLMYNEFPDRLDWMFICL